MIWLLPVGVGVVVGGLAVANAIQARKEGAPPPSADPRTRMSRADLLKLLQGQIFGIIIQETKEGVPPAQVRAAKVRIANLAASTADMVGLPKTASALRAIALAWTAGKSGSELQPLLQQEKWPGTDESVLDYLMARRPGKLRGY